MATPSRPQGNNQAAEDSELRRLQNAVRGYRQARRALAWADLAPGERRRWEAQEQWWRDRLDALVPDPPKG